VDFVRRWSDKTEIGAGRFIGWLDIAASKFYNWRERYGKVNEHNSHNNVRLNSATGFITPRDMLAGRQQDIHAERGRKLEAARKQRRFDGSKWHGMRSGQRLTGQQMAGWCPDGRVRNFAQWRYCPRHPWSLDPFFGVHIRMVSRPLMDTLQYPTFSATAAPHFLSLFHHLAAIGRTVPSFGPVWL
jgi:hypothetical protein